MSRQVEVTGGQQFPVFVPPHQLKRDYTAAQGPMADLHDAFQRRLEPEAYTVENFAAVRRALEAAHEAHPGDARVRCELAFMLLADRCTPDQVTRAAGLLIDLDPTYEAPSGSVAPSRLRALVDAVGSRTSQDRSGVVLDRVNWSVNNECPMACRGCYNPFSSHDLDVEEAKRIIDRLLEHGTTSVVMSGGDPLLWRSLLPVVEYASGQGISVAVDTTGYTLTPQLLEALRGHITSLRLPLDGLDSATEHAFRRNGDRSITERLLDRIRMCDEAGFDALRINTVVSRRNIGQLRDLADEVWSHPSVAQWMVFQWWGRRAPRQLVQEMHVDFAEIDRICEDLETARSDKAMFWVEGADRDFVNFMIQANGQVVTFANGPAEEFILGDLTRQSLSEVLSNPVIDVNASLANIPLTGWSPEQIAAMSSA